MVRIREIMVKKKPHFMMGFDPAMCSQRLNIPCNFVKHMEGRASGTVLLFGPSGHNWYSELTLIGDGLFFNNGWAEFASDHFLEKGDSLVFRYDGNLQFTVQIFDQSMCEKEASFNAESSQDSRPYNSYQMVKKRGIEIAENAVVEGVPKKMRGDLEAIRCSELENDVTVAVLPLAAVSYDRLVDSPVSNRITERDVCLSSSEAEKISGSFTSSFPNFIRVMKRFNISGSYTLHIPYQFATEHLPKCKLKTILQNIKGESWTINSIPTTRVQTSHTFCGGWLRFVQDNNIGIGDTCIFELVKKFEFLVRILRVIDEGMDNSHHGKAPQDGRNTKKSREVHRGSVGKQGSQTKGFMSMKSVPEEKIAAQHFVSSFPHFVRLMKKFNVSGSYTLKIPYQFSMENLPNCKSKIILRNLNGQFWTVNSIPTVKVQTLHTLCGGWMAFVRDNNIQMGDICIFELVGNCEMCVHVCGLGKKGLNYQNGAKNLPIP